MCIFLNEEVEDESAIMARLESELAENILTSHAPEKPDEENKEKTLTKKEKKKKKMAKDSPDKEGEPDEQG